MDPKPLWGPESVSFKNYFIFLWWFFHLRIFMHAFLPTFLQLKMKISKKKFLYIETYFT